jgi:hypothetical protein
MHTTLLNLVQGHFVDFVRGFVDRVPRPVFTLERGVLWILWTAARRRYAQGKIEGEREIFKRYF